MNIEITPDVMVNLVSVITTVGFIVMMGGQYSFLEKKSERQQLICLRALRFFS